MKATPESSVVSKNVRLFRLFTGVADLILHRNEQGWVDSRVEIGPQHRSHAPAPPTLNNTYMRLFLIFATIFPLQLLLQNFIK